MDIYAIRKQNLINLIGTRRKNACALKWEMAPAHLSQILSDRTEKNLGDDVARRIESLEGLERGWMDQLREPGLDGSVEAPPASGKTPADLVRAMLATKAGKALPKEARERLLGAAEEPLSGVVEPSGNVIRADFSRRPTRGDEISIAHYDVRGAMGSGKLVREYPEMLRDVIVSQEHLRELGVKYQDPAHLKMITGDGESMAPTIKHLDPLIVDASIREFTGDGIYAFTYQGLFYIKRLQLRGAEHFKMLSDNTLHPPEDIRIEETYIQARVLLVWNARRV
ncbi:S24 family peptidase [Pseudomonas sp. TUM22785]|uniref:S24 family peptidase n=1 Tax=Pseudomonas sp. TUM22785 TaxID=3019098 RepID=UPI0023057F71|nr:S24 family peptidase [Pseudomonas sp. TUM22785]WCD79171.1 S24 family peptidase [Pseudomonas sp. TUM22785]